MTKNKLVLKFPKSLIDKPILSKIIKEFDIEVNILKANISPNAEGVAIIEFSGKEENYKKTIDYLKSLKIETQHLEKDIARDEDKCTHCSACVSHCPSAALYIKDRKTMKVEFDPEKCIACEACIPVCPFKAMSLKI